MLKPICPICENEMRLDKEMSDWKEYYCHHCYEGDEDGWVYDINIMQYNNGKMEFQLATMYNRYLDQSCQY